MKAKISLLLVVLIFSVLALLDWDFVHNTVIAPIQYVFWAGNIFLKSIPTKTYLLLLLLAGVILGWNTIETIRGRPAAQTSETNQPLAETRYLHWKRLCANVDSNWFSRNQFAADARELLLSILAYTAEIDAPETENRIRDGSLQVPDVISRVIQEKKLAEPPGERVGIPPVPWFTQEEPPDTSSIDPQLEQIISFLEHYLEIDHHAGSHFSD